MARVRASRANSSSTPAISTIIRPGFIFITHSSIPALPLPIRVCRGFLVSGLSGKTLIQVLAWRFTWRVRATRAASIWREFTRPASTAFIPISPIARSAPRVALPRFLPFICLRNLVRFGINMIIYLFLLCAVFYRLFLLRSFQVERLFEEPRL